jgi:hypothetical protein
MLIGMGNIVNTDSTSRSKYYGKLPPECLRDLDSLLIKMRRINRKNAGRKVIRRNEIVPLPNDEFVRLWGYIRHCCQLATSWPNVRSAIRVVATNSSRDFEDVLNECIDSMTIHVYTYSWRRYRHSDECGYVFKTAEYGYKSWIESQNAYMLGEDAALVIHQEETYSGRKVSGENSRKSADVS